MTPSEGDPVATEGDDNAPLFTPSFTNLWDHVMTIPTTLDVVSQELDQQPLELDLSAMLDKASGSSPTQTDIMMNVTEYPEIACEGVAFPLNENSFEQSLGEQWLI